MLWLDQKKTVVADTVALAEGMFASTPIAVGDGWTLVADLRPGDLVLTFDDGPQRIRSIRSQPPTEHIPAMRIPRWALGNVQDLYLLPEQTVMIEADLAEDLYGEPFVTMPVSALEGWMGIHRTAPPPEASYQLLFDTAQLVYAGGDVLLGCAGQPSLHAVLGQTGPTAVPLGPAAARHLVACLMAEAAGEELRRALAAQL